MFSLHSLTLTLFLKYAKFKQAIYLQGYLVGKKKKKKHEISDSIFQVIKSSSWTLVVGPYIGQRQY